MRAFLAVLILAAALGACGGPNPPADVVAQISKVLAEGAEHGGPNMPTNPPRGMIQTLDLSRDGSPDYLVDYGKQGFSGWCGTGGCRQQIYVSTPHGYVLALDGQILFAPKVSEAGGETVLDIELHGTYCGLTGVEPCQRRFAWTPTTARLEERPNAAGIARLQAPLFQPVELAGALPEQARKDVAACIAAGGGADITPPQVLSVPDLNGDSVRDTIIDATYSLCSKDGSLVGPQPASHVLLSGQDPTTEAAVLSNVYEIDISTRPARLVMVMSDETCVSGPAPCPEVVLAYDPASGQMAPIAVRP